MRGSAHPTFVTFPAKKFCLLTLTILTLLGSVQGRAGWRQLNGPYGGNLYTVCAGPGVVAAAGASEIYCSTNNGDSWVRRYEYGRFINSLLYFNGRVFAALDRGGLISTGDAGATWSAASGIPADESMNILALDGTMILAGAQGRLYISLDSGQTWTYQSAPDFIFSVAGVGGKVFAGSFNGLYVSNDTGKTWAVSTNGLRQVFIYSLYASGTTVYAGTQAGFYISTNLGESWAVTGGSELRNTQVNGFAGLDTIVFAATSAGIYRKTPGNPNWTRSDMGYTGAAFSLAHYNGILYAPSGNNNFNGAGGGVYRSTDRGATWEAASTGMAQLPINSFLISGSTIFVGTTGGGLYASTDQGSTWRSRNNGNTSGVVNGIRSIGGSLYVFGGTGILRSTDGGEHWAAINSGLPVASVSALLATDTALFCGVAGRGVYKSTDLGTSWKAMNLGMSTSTVTSFMPYDSIIFATTIDRGVFRIRPREIVWINVGTGMPINQTNCLHRFGDVVFAGTNGLGMFYSANLGDSWERIVFDPMQIGIEPIYIRSIVSIASTILAGTGDFGVMTSVDNGLSWQQGNSGLSTMSITSLSLIGTTVYAGTAQGLWTASLDEVLDVAPAADAVPFRHALHQNYPNPFNPTTTIAFVIAENSVTDISVYDILGEKVVTLVNQQMNPGTFTATWDGRDEHGDALSSGVYFVRMHAAYRAGETFTQMRKIVLVK